MPLRLDNASARCPHAHSYNKNNSRQLIEIGLKVTHTTARRSEKIDANFVADYGEWGSTLPAWQENNWRFNSKLCERLGRVPTLQMLLVCERFRVVYAR